MRLEFSVSEAFLNFEWKRRAQESILQGALTNSKRPECFIEGVYPTHLSKGEGCYLFDSENKKYIDYICGLGSNLFGYANLHINEAVTRQLFKGAVLSLSSTLEVECAELLKERLHFVSKLRFLKTGTEACMGAIKIARAHTGRSKILSRHYHGWSDPFISLSPPSIGVPADPNIEILVSINNIDETVAAVIIEPVVTDYSSSNTRWLMSLKEKCKSTGTLLIFDEIITGMRYRGFTVANDTGIYPDIICLGKAFGGGLPISVIGCAQGIGEGKEWFISSTFAGDLLALAAFKKCLDLLTNTNKIDDLWIDGNRFITDFNGILPDKIWIEGYPTRGVFKSDTDLTKALFFQESCKAGILFGSSWFYNFKHPEVREIVISACRDILQRIKHGHVKLEGKMPTTPFAQKQRG